MKVFKFGAMLRHGTEQIYITTTATSRKQARRQILDFKGAPASAVLRFDCLGRVA